MITKQQLSKLKGWHYPTISNFEVMRMSGWKFYISGNTIEDSFQIGNMVTPIAHKYNLTMKIASQNIINRNTSKGNIAWSIAVIYLNAEIFEEKKVGELVDELNKCLENYHPSGKVTGAKPINCKLHYRYDLTKPINPSEGVEYGEYLKLYRGENGEYNIPENEDITSFLKH